MRVDPKAPKKAAGGDAAPAPQPKKQFAAILKDGRPAPVPNHPAQSPKTKPAQSPPPSAPKPALERPAPKPEDETHEPAETVVEAPAQPMQFAPPVEAAAPTAAAAPVAPIERLADEVVLIARADGSTEIQAEVDSKVIADLRISVTQRGDRIEVRLLTDTPATQRMLEQAVPQLSQALQARNLTPALLQVAPRAAAPPLSPGTPRRPQQRDRDGRRERDRR